jgi:hypothetical protein
VGGGGVMNSLFTSVELKELVAFVTAVVGGAFALWRWTIDQKWRRVQYAQTLIKEFLGKKNTKNAFEIIDTVGNVEFAFDGSTKRKKTINITDRFLVEALKTFSQKERFTDNEVLVRDTFDEFFGDISIFQMHIEAGLIKLNDIRPYLEYWIKELSGNGNVHEKHVARQVGKYLSYFGYQPVLSLVNRMGYTFEK